MKQKETGNNGQLSPGQQMKLDFRTLINKVSYRAIVSNVPYIAFITLLGVVYISNNQGAIEMQRVMSAQNKTLKELGWKYMNIKSELINAKMETQVIRSAAVIGLKPLQLPAYKIETDSNSINRVN